MYGKYIRCKYELAREESVVRARVRARLGR